MVTTEDYDDDDNNENKVKKRSIKHCQLLSVEEQEVIAGLNPARIAKYQICQNYDFCILVHLRDNNDRAYLQ